jgi:hypothetical protein
MENTHVSKYNSTSSRVLSRHIKWYMGYLCKFLRHVSATTGLKMKLKLLKIPKIKKTDKAIVCNSGLRLGPEHMLNMAWIVQPYSQDACGIGSGPFAALG